MIRSPARAASPCASRSSRECPGVRRIRPQCRSEDSTGPSQSALTLTTHLNREAVTLLPVDDRRVVGQGLISDLACQQERSRPQRAWKFERPLDLCQRAERVKSASAEAFAQPLELHASAPVLVRADGVALLAVAARLAEVGRVGRAEDVEAVAVVGGDDDQRVLELANVGQVLERGVDGLVKLEDLAERARVVWRSARRLARDVPRTCCAVRPSPQATTHHLFVDEGSLRHHDPAQAVLGRALLQDCPVSCSTRPTPHCRSP